MRILAIDYGDARTGLAFSDSTGVLTGEAFTLHEKDGKRLLSRVDEEARKRSAGLLVLGLPRNMDGSEGVRAEKTRAFATLLEQKGWTVELWDERRSTVDAARILHQNGVHGSKNRARVDAVAASLILEGYLLRRMRQNESG